MPERLKTLLEAWGQLLPEGKQGILPGLSTYFCVKISSAFGFILMADIHPLLEYFLPLFKILLETFSSIAVAVSVVIATHYAKRKLNKKYPISEPPKNN